MDYTPEECSEFTCEQCGKNDSAVIYAADRPSVAEGISAGDGEKEFWCDECWESRPMARESS